LTIEALNRASLYQYINSLYSFVKSCDEDTPILDKLEEDARSLIKVISEKRDTRTREMAVARSGSVGQGG
jgi:DNA-binding ferritin-like protein